MIIFFHNKKLFHLLVNEIYVKLLSRVQNTKQYKQQLYGVLQLLFTMKSMLHSTTRSFKKLRLCCLTTFMTTLNKEDSNMMSI